MTARPIDLGDVLLVALPVQDPRGHEQEGLRPAVVVGVPERVGIPRYPLSLVVPLTTRGGTWAERSPELYPVLKADSGGLTRTSVALLDQLRSLDLGRVRGYLGSLEEEEFAPIREGIGRICGLRYSGPAPE